MIPVQNNTPQVVACKELLTNLLQSIKLCQIRFGGRTELATELDSHVVDVCYKLEAVMNHGLRSKTFRQKKPHSTIKHVTDLVLGGNGQESVVFWHFVREFLTKHERDRYEQLKNIHTDFGRGRAWLRSALNEKSLERYMLTLIDAPPEHVRVHYEDWAFLRNQELSNVLPQSAAGLASITFAINICRTELDSDIGHVIPPEPIIPAPTTIPLGENNKSKKKRVTGNIISFDDTEDMSGSFGRSSPSQSTPPTEVTVGVECVEPLLEENGGISDAEIGADSDVTSDSENNRGLRPVSNVNIGELIPVPLTEETQTSEDSLSVPSFSEDADRASLEAVEACTDSAVTGGGEVERLREANQGLKAELRQAARLHQQELESVRVRNMTLDRENEVLRHQLRKYVGAVQMLKQQEGQAHSQEAELYERKLVQVAEMHAELMELNERLQRTLTMRETTIRRLRSELESLRGPLLESEEEGEVGSAALVSLWVPSVFLAGQGGSHHHVYQIHLRICDEEWNVYRRYAQFYLLHKTLKKDFPIIGTFHFPPKRTLGNKDAKFVEERRQKLQQYLRRVMNHLLSADAVLTSAPSKLRLITLLPFLGDLPAVDHSRRSSPFSRNPIPDSPQYTGL